MHIINQMKYPHVLLCGTVISLLAASCAYAVESPVTPGPSVGHRPVINGLKLGMVNSLDKLLTDSFTILKVGDVIGLMNIPDALSVGDVDVDDPKAGAYCVWWRISPDNSHSAIVKDPGNDFSCRYTIKTDDIGYKLKGVVTVYSNNNSYFTVNPAASLPTEQISANTVSNNFFDKIIVAGGHSFTLKESFPTTGFKGASFKLQLSTGLLTDYNWKTDTPWISVNNGVVTFESEGDGRNVTITAEPKGGTGGNLTYTFKLDSWFQYSATGMPHGQALTFCDSLPGYSPVMINELTYSAYGNQQTGKKTGRLMGEWGSSLPGITGSFNNSWTTETYGKSYAYTVSLINGTANRALISSQLIAICKRAL